MSDVQQPDASAIAAAMCTGEVSIADVDVHAFGTLGSTSAWLRDKRASMNASLEQGRVQLCVTDWQQSGEGRRGKTFRTSPGNVTFSMLVRIPASAQQLLGLSLVTGIAVARSLERTLKTDAMLKWPNDVMLNDRKLGGLLTELVTIGSDEHGKISTDVITGIGINVLHDEAVVEMGIGATSLSQAGIEVSRSARDALIGDIAASVLEYHKRLVTHGWTYFASAWQTRDWLDGKAVLVHKQDSSEPAIACGVNEQGALLVDSNGTLLPLYGGNVSIRPR